MRADNDGRSAVALEATPPVGDGLLARASAAVSAYRLPSCVPTIRCAPATAGREGDAVEWEGPEDVAGGRLEGLDPPVRGEVQHSTQPWSAMSRPERRGFVSISRHRRRPGARPRRRRPRLRRRSPSRGRRPERRLSVRLAAGDAISRGRIRDRPRRERREFPSRSRPASRTFSPAMTGVSVKTGVAKRHNSRAVAESKATAIPTSVGTTRIEPCTAIDRVEGPGRSSCQTTSCVSRSIARTLPVAPGTGRPRSCPKRSRRTAGRRRSPGYRQRSHRAVFARRRGQSVDLRRRDPDPPSRRSPTHRPQKATTRQRSDRTTTAGGGVGGRTLGTGHRSLPRRRRRPRSPPTIRSDRRASSGSRWSWRHRVRAPLPRRSLPRHRGTSSCPTGAPISGGLGAHRGDAGQERH